MTWVNLALEKSRVLALSDTEIMPFNSDVPVEGRHRKINNAGLCLITGRGASEVISRFASTVQSAGLQGFDQIKSQCSSLFREVWREFFMEPVLKKHPGCPPEILERFIDDMQGQHNGANAEIFIAGYSSIQKKMQLAVVASYSGYELVVIDSPSLFAPEGPAADDYLAKLGRIPRTGRELQVLLAKQFRWATTDEWKKSSASSLASKSFTESAAAQKVKAPEGPIEMCTLSVDGSADYRDVGTFADCFSLADEFDSSTLAGSKTVNLGRNSPCPCGSGKKFKRCCGGK